MFKTCSRCGKVKNIRDFVKDKRYKGGVTNICRACRNAYNRERYLLHREKFLKRTKVWTDKNKDRLRLLAKEYYKRHRTRIIKQNKKYYEDHRQACQARRKLWGIKNKEVMREYNKKYKLEHKIASL